ncbi:prepilin peptidase [Gimesia fumaroli]|uniref:Leader peptidase PppA n=1 Tax=Gimesia fumaroli TaxID=2527976 RepID=A0A518I7P6_9PLAN|nr:A24 family peptidase [Gimesia fumaroli]QDV49123.1 Leader peptidase PppA [Gimesia fumaroli]
MTPFGINPYLILLLLFLLGTVLGRLINLCIEEIPREEKVGAAWARVARRMRHLWSRYHIPIIGVYLTRSRDSTFPYKRSQREALVELLNGVIFVLLYCAEVPLSGQSTLQDSGLFSAYAPDPAAMKNSLLSPVALLNLRYAFHLVLIESLMIATFIDFDLKIIPDGATMPAMFFGVVGSFVFGYLYLVPVWFQEPSIVRLMGLYFPEQYRASFVVEKVPRWIEMYPHLHGLAVSLVGLVVGGGVVWAVRIIGQWTLRQEAMGFGDVILMAVIGSFLGWQATVTVFVISPLCALAVVAVSIFFKQSREIPFGPYLSLGALLVLLGWPQIWPLAERICHMGPLLPILSILMLVLLAACLLFTQMMKWMLGIPLYWQEEWLDEWTSADQLTYQSGENVDENQGRWERGADAHTRAGRGTQYNHQWKKGR